MPGTDDTQDAVAKLLSILELDKTMAEVAGIIAHRTKCDAIGIAAWDAEMEEYADRGCFGAGRKKMSEFLDEFVKQREELSDDTLTDLDLKQFESNHLERVFMQPLRHGGELCAVLLMSVPQDANMEELSALLKSFPLGTVFKNAWVYTELDRENKRLRRQYDQIEVQIEESTRKTLDLIHDLTWKDSLRTKQVERERLVFSISSIVKSSVRIQEVLMTAVEQIGTTLASSRCHVLRSDKDDRIEVYEYHAPNVSSVKEHLLATSGVIFTRAALLQKTPQPLDESSDGTAGGEGCDSDFRELLGMRSGLTVPIVIRERVLGVLFLQDCEQTREWSIDDISLLGSLADNLAVAIENAELHLEIERQAVTDGLTGVANRRSFNDSLSKEFDRAKRYDQPLSLVVIDLDFLKKINDTYGHMTGDEAIKAIGGVLMQSSRSTDLTARYGGEEFCVLLPNTGIDMAEQLAERLRRLIRKTHVEGPGVLSASLGVAAYPLHADSPDSLFLRADEALYQAKQNGRNRVKVSNLGPDGQPLSPAGPPGPAGRQSMVQEKS
jgi:diguanylate cyclase (GGDEF)-like protein